MNEFQKDALCLLERLITRPMRTRVRELLADPAHPCDELCTPGRWCHGWAFTVLPAHGDALDCTISTRYVPKKVIGPDGKLKDTLLLDAHGEPLYKMNADLSPILDKKGNRIYIKDCEKITEWSQGSAFCFSEGHTLHGTDQGNPVCVQVETYTPASPASKKSPRDSGMVTFRFLKRTRTEPQWPYGSIETTTQDDFVRFLISGELPWGKRRGE